MFWTSNATFVKKIHNIQLKLLQNNKINKIIVSFDIFFYLISTITNLDFVKVSKISW